MAKKGKARISKVKRNNQTTNKMKKQGKLRLQRHRPKDQKQKQNQSLNNQIEYSSESEAESNDEWADMLDEEEQQYIMQRLAKDPKLLSSVPVKDEGAQSQKKPRKRPRPSSADISPDSGADTDSAASDVEDKYEKELAERPVKKMKSLLPIKTKDGLIPREVEDDAPDSDNEQVPSQKQPSSAPDDEEGSEEESGSDSGVEPEGEQGEVISTVQLLAARRDTLNKEKLRIGALCSSLLETPERKLKNFFPILYLMEETLKDGTTNLHSVRKIATLSAFEVFKDILPDYVLRHQDYANVKLKKDTLSLYKYEKELLEFYKRYLQRLEKATSVLRKKKGDTRKPDQSSTDLAMVSLRCLCGMLTSRPSFNYAVNIAQSVVPLLGHRSGDVRDAVTQCCSQVFHEDSKGDITLAIVRLINQLVKRRGTNLHPSALDCLLKLKIKDVDLDAEAEVKHKQATDTRHKKRIINLSKKEKKRAKKLKEVERELLETQAQESEVVRKKQMTEVTKTVFHIYFRVLKRAPHSELLVAVLNGLAKFAHVINIEFYSELVGIFSQLLVSAAVSARGRLLAVLTALSVLSGAGDALTLNPRVFHDYLYHHFADVDTVADGELMKTALQCVLSIASRSRQVSPVVMCALAKKLAIASLQTPHRAVLAALAIMYQLAQHSKQVSSMLIPSEEVSPGRYEPYLPSAEHSGAESAVLYEMTALCRHYHPTVRSAVTALVTEQPALLREFIKVSPLQIFDQYDSSQMSFKPAIPPPKPAKPKNRVPEHVWTQTTFRDECTNIEGRVDSSNVDFKLLYRNNV